jgi:peptidoglycan/LPS O-acetylase OafA/YrhL
MERIVSVPPSPNARLKYRADIDGIRAVAVLVVVAYHAFPALVPGGFVGVDVFFVISGFLISGIIFGSLERGAFSFADFYRRRIRRIFPALIVVLAASCVLGWFLLLPAELEQLGKHVAGGAGFLSNFILWREAGYFDNAASTKPLLHLWSLGVEEQFYIVWPLAVFAAWRLRFNLLWAVAAIFAASFVLNVFFVERDLAFDFYSPATRLWELLAGGALAYLTFRRRGTDDTGGAAGNLISGLGLAAIGVALAAIDRTSAFPGWWATLPVAGTCLLLSAGSGSWLNRTVLANPALVAIGLISYPLYLWHWPLLSFANILQSGNPGPGLRMGAVALSFVLAWGTYRLVEVPIRFGVFSGRKTYAACAALLAIGCIGIVIDIEGGFSGRRTYFAHAPADAQSLARYLERLGADPGYVDRLDEERTAAVRSPYCHFDDATFDANKAGILRCVTVVEGKPNVLIVGDSHAADLYATLVSAYGTVNFLQVTGAGCTPFSSARVTRQCHALLYLALSFARAHRLDAIIMAAAWPETYYGIGQDIAQLKSFSQKVILVGPPVEFTADVSKIIQRRPELEPFDAYMADHLEPATRAFDRQMAAFARSNGADFISYVDLYCGNGICPALDESGELLILGNSHLTVPGARYLGAAFRRNRILETILDVP